jgi:hypothetical protein
MAKEKFYFNREYTGLNIDSSEILVSNIKYLPGADPGFMARGA